MAEGYVVRTMLKRPDTLERDEIVRENVRAVIAIGGDGTLRSVADRVSSEYRAVDRPMPPMLVMPLGTANLMGRHLGIAWSDRRMEAEVAAVIRAQKVVELDAARANGALFLLMAGVGFDAHVVHELARVRTGPITMASYALPAAMSVKAYDYPPLTVSVDGVKVADRVPGFAFVGNI